MDDWLTRHMHGVLIAVEVLWVGGFLAIFVLYFYIKSRLKHKKPVKKKADVSKDV